MGVQAPMGCTSPAPAPWRSSLRLVAFRRIAMRQFDFSPLYRSTVGFDRLFSALDQVSGYDGSATTYPPYNIERTSDSTYRVSVAVAGFAENDIAIEVKENALTIRGEK